ncbi:helix-turn-helix domain-containing protein [Actinoplanes sp. NPDC020271]|uniref:helix-turn-helix domain-containing protein n=1 Tax=Actinoplanes sp. NPDC020271 TaxID=3363896 RepID=UPI0037900595
MESDEGPAGVGSGTTAADGALLGVSVGAAFWRTREAAGLTLEDLERRSKVPREVLAKLEVSAGDCKVDVLHAVAHALAVPLSRLVADAEAGRS